VAKKKKEKTTPATWVAARLEGILTLLRGPARPVALGGLMLVVLAGVWVFVWQGVRDRVLACPDYWLTAADMEVTPPPDWIHADVAAEVFRDASLERSLSIMEPDLTARLAERFSRHPWVANVLEVRKYHPARVRAELVYRRPVCMVQWQGGLEPVDVRGVLLPGDDFSPLEKSRYPRLMGIDRGPLGPAGTRWGDVRVVEGAQIADALGKAWKALNLDRIVPRLQQDLNRREQYTYVLFTREGTEILWGHAPGSDRPGEPPAADKVARLKEYAQEHGSLEGVRGPQRLDVRG